MNDKTNTLLADYVTIDDLLAEFNCSKRTIQRWVSERGFPKGLRTPGGVRWRKSSIMQWLRKQTSKENRFHSL